MTKKSSLIFILLLALIVKGQDSIKTSNIEEVELISKREIEGAALKKNNGWIRVDSFHQSFAALNRFTLAKKSRVIAYNFYINSPNRNNKMPMKFIVYKEVDGVLEIVAIQDILIYKKGFNHFLVSNLVLPVDTYYFGLFWDMKNKEEYTYPFKFDLVDSKGKLIEKNKVRYFTGPTLGFKNVENPNNECYNFADNKLKKLSNIIIYQNIEYR